MRSNVACGLFLLSATVLAAAPASPPAGPQPPERIANGVPTQVFPSTGWLLIGDGSYCSGVLVGCQTFLTAAHCVCGLLSGTQCLVRPDLLNPNRFTVFLQNAGNFSVSSVAVTPVYQFAVDGDFAVLHLTNPVTGVAPSALNAAARPPAGTTGTIVGFGLTPSGSFDLGIKRTGQVKTSTCSVVSNTTNLCWRYDTPLGAPGSNSDTCEGDSGGPLFVDLGEGPVVAGLTSGGTTNCVPLDDSFDSDAYVDRAFLLSAGGADLGTASCGGLPAVGGPGATVVTGSGTLSTATPSQSFNLTVPPGALTLRVTVNAEPIVAVDLYVKQGSTASPGNFDCHSPASFVPNACEIPSPAPGPWSVLVQGGAGTTDFQMTATFYTLPGEAFHTLAPCRLVDTRNPAGPLGGPALQPGGVRNFQFAGACGVPSDAKALSVNIAVTQPAAIGFLRIYPGDSPALPLISVINFAPGQTRTNNAILASPTSSALGTNVRNDSAGPVHFILDVNGYFQ